MTEPATVPRLLGGAFSEISEATALFGLIEASACAQLFRALSEVSRELHPPEVAVPALGQPPRNV